MDVSPEATQQPPEVCSNTGGRRRPNVERVRDGRPIRVGQHRIGCGRAREAVFVEPNDERVGPAGMAASRDRGDVETARPGRGAHHDERVGESSEPFERLPWLSVGMLLEPPLHVGDLGDEPVLRVVVELALRRRHLLQKQSGPLHDRGRRPSLRWLALHES